MRLIQEFTTTDFQRGRGGRKVQVSVTHITDGDTATGAIGWWRRPDVEASANDVIDRNGDIYEVVAAGDTPWTNGNINQPDMSNPFIARWVREGIRANQESYTVEVVGKPGQPIPKAQWDSLVWRYATVYPRLGLPIERERFVGHNQIDSVTRSRCPSFTPTQWTKLVQEVRAMAGGDPANAFDAYRANHPGCGAAVFRGQLFDHSHWMDWLPKEATNPLDILWCERSVLAYSSGEVADVTGYALNDAEKALGSQLVQFRG